jgi:DUF1680 family protein
MRSLPLSRIQITDRFWGGYQQRLIERTLPAQFEQIVATERLANFHRAAGREEGSHAGLCFNDSDIYKYVEACAYALAATEASAMDDARRRVREQMDEAIEAVVDAQMPDGYIKTYFQLKHPTMRWRNLGAVHEMYCGGHLIEAGVAAFECLGDRRLLDVGIRFADHVMSIFAPSERRGYPGHEEIELALIRLANATGEMKYREYARWLVEERGQPDSPFAAELRDPESRAVSQWAGTLLEVDGVYSGEYAQDHAPIREHTQIVGHAVRAMYLYIAATELADGQNDPALEAALERIWNNLTQRRMYITGGIGPSAKNEGFTADFDLPNMSAYAETCAAIGLVFWGRGLLGMTGVSDYVDVYERALYNGVLSGISLDGTDYFYDNPLESRGQHRRTPWFTCACCPPNIARLIGSIGWYVASEAEGAFYIHIPAGFQAETKINGTAVRISIDGEYPWSGRFQVSIEPSAPVQFALKIRIPDWADEVETELPDDVEEADYADGYAVFDRVWHPGDSVAIDLGMRPKWMEADPRVRDDLGRLALTCGPLVYCAEETDLGFAPQLLTVDPATELAVDRSGERTTIDVEGLRELETPIGQLYAEAGTVGMEEVDCPFIPYFAWGNRGPTNMQVWVRAQPSP